MKKLKNQFLKREVKQSNQKTIEELKAGMLNEVSIRLDEFINGYYRISKQELRLKIQELDRHALENGERLGMFQLVLAATIYKKRFKREIMLRGVRIDATGNIVRNDAYNIPSKL